MMTTKANGNFLASAILGVICAIVLHMAVSPLMAMASENINPSKTVSLAANIEVLPCLSNMADVQEGDTVDLLDNTVTPLSGNPDNSSSTLYQEYLRIMESQPEKTELATVSSVITPTGVYTADTCETDPAGNTVVTTSNGDTVVLDGISLAVYEASGNINVYAMADCIIETV